MQVDYDKSLVSTLPLPLAQLYRRAFDAPEPIQRHQAAYYLWESSVRLLGIVGIVECSERRLESSELISLAKRKRGKFSSGEWWGICRDLLVPSLTNAGDSGFAKVGSLVFDAKADLHRCAELYASLQGATAPVKPTVDIRALFDELVTYRNDEIGHGAMGMDTSAYYDAMAMRLRSGLGELLRKFDPLAGRRLIYVSGTSLTPHAGWQIDYRLLSGPELPAVTTLEIRQGISNEALPLPGRLFLAPPSTSGGPLGDLHLWQPLAPFAVARGDGVYLFNSRRGRGRPRLSYLNFSTGEKIEEVADDREVSKWESPISELLAVSEPTSDSNEQAEAPKDATVHQESTAYKLPRFIGGYEILGKLGSGASGIVYRALQPNLGLEVALKQLARPEGEHNYSRFEREMRTLARVNHPSVVKIHTSGSQNGLFWFTMDLIAGADLSNVHHALSSSLGDADSQADWDAAVAKACETARNEESGVQTKRTTPNADAPVREPVADAGASQVASPPSPMTAFSSPGGYLIHVVELIRQVAEGAHSLHQQGIIHRDIKPGNIRVTADGKRAVLVDLGLVKLADENDGSLTRTGQIVGTLRYTSPEQALCSPTVDRRADVYSLGATLWEMLTLRSLFDAGPKTPQHQLMGDIQRTDPPSPRKYNKSVSVDLAAIVQKCLEKEPQHRYASAQALADDLARWQRGEPVEARIRSTWYRVTKVVARHWVALATAAVVLYAFSATIASGLIYSARQAAIVAKAQAETAKTQAETDKARAEEERVKAENATQLADAAKRQAASLASASLIRDALAFDEKGDANAAMAAIAQAMELDKDNPERMAANRMCLISALGQNPYLESIATGESDVHSAKFDQEGRLLAALHKSGSVEIWNVDHMKIAWRTSSDDPASAILVSDRGFWTAILHRNGKLGIYRTDAIALNRAQENQDEPPLPAYTFTTQEKGWKAWAFSPDEKWLATADVKGTTTVSRLDPEMGLGSDRARAVTPPVGSYFQWGPQVFEKQSPEIDHVVSLAFSADSKKLATVDTRKTIKIWDMEKREQLQWQVPSSSPPAPTSSSKPEGFVRKPVEFTSKESLSLALFDDKDRLWFVAGPNPAPIDLGEYSPVMRTSEIHLWDFATYENGPRARLDVGGAVVEMSYVPHGSKGLLRGSARTNNRTESFENTGPDLEEHSGVLFSTSRQVIPAKRKGSVLGSMQTRVEGDLLIVSRQGRDHRLPMGHKIAEAAARFDDSFAVFTANGALTRWRTENRMLTHFPEEGNPELSGSPWLSKRGDLAVRLTADARELEWREVSTGRMLAKARIGDDFPRAYSNDGKTVFTQKGLLIRLGQQGEVSAKQVLPKGECDEVVFDPSNSFAIVRTEDDDRRSLLLVDLVQGNAHTLEWSSESNNVYGGPFPLALNREKGQVLVSTSTGLESRNLESGSPISAVSISSGAFITRCQFDALQSLAAAQDGEHSIHFLDPLSLRSVHPALTFEVGITRYQLDDRGELLAVHAGDTVGLYRLKDSELLHQWNHQGAISEMVFSPDGKYLALAENDVLSVQEYPAKVFIYDTSEGRAASLPLRLPKGLQHLAWSSEGRSLASICGTRPQIWNLTAKGISSDALREMAGVQSNRYFDGNAVLRRSSMTASTEKWSKLTPNEKAIGHDAANAIALRLRQIEDLELAGDWQLAAELVEPLIGQQAAAGSQADELRLRYARALKNSGQFEKAIEAYRELSRNSPRALPQLFRVLMEHASTILLAADEVDPSNAMDFEQAIDKALATCRKALEIEQVQEEPQDFFGLRVQVFIKLSRLARKSLSKGNGFKCSELIDEAIAFLPKIVTDSYWIDDELDEWGEFGKEATMEELSPPGGGLPIALVTGEKLAKEAVRRAKDATALDIQAKLINLTGKWAARAGALNHFDLEARCDQEIVALWRVRTELEPNDRHNKVSLCGALRYLANSAEKAADWKLAQKSIGESLSLYAVLDNEEKFSSDQLANWYEATRVAARVYIHFGQFEDATKATLEGVEVVTRIVAERASLENRMKLADAFGEAGSRGIDVNDLGFARKHWMLARKLREILLEPADDNDELKKAIGVADEWLADIENRLGRFASSLKYADASLANRRERWRDAIDRSLEAAEQAARLESLNYAYIWAFNCALDAGNLEDAKRFAQEYEQLFVEQINLPENPYEEKASVLSRIAEFKKSLAELNAACDFERQSLDEALAVAKKQKTFTNHLSIANRRRNLALADWRNGRLPEALAGYSEALRELVDLESQKEFEAVRGAYLNTLNHLRLLELDRGDFPAALARARELIERINQGGGPRTGETEMFKEVSTHLALSSLSESTLMGPFPNLAEPEQAKWLRKLRSRSAAMKGDSAAALEEIAELEKLPNPEAKGLSAYESALQCADLAQLVVRGFSGAQQESRRPAQQLFIQTAVDELRAAIANDPSIAGKMAAEDGFDPIRLSSAYRDLIASLKEPVIEEPQLPAVALQSEPEPAPLLSDPSASREFLPAPPLAPAPPR